MKRSNPHITRFELTAVLADRAEKLANGEPSTVNTQLTNPIDIAFEEYKQNKLPTRIKRTFLDNTVETWTVNELLTK
jgi:DNA-directed RNA polymerase subunit K/omega